MGSFVGQYDRDYLQTKRLRITVRDVTRKLRQVELLIYFIGRHLPDGDRFIYSHNQIPVVFSGNLEVTGDIPGPQITLNQHHCGWTGRSRFHGEEIRGWIIVGRAGSRIFDTRASGPDLLEHARDSQQPDSLRAMIAAAHIHDEPLNPTVPSQTPPQSAVGQQPLPPAAARSPSSSPPQFTTLLKTIPVTLPYGQATLQPGTKFQVVSRNGQSVQILYGGSTITVPISSTDLK